jgi:hypothetical protein
MRVLAVSPRRKVQCRSSRGSISNTAPRFVMNRTMPCSRQPVVSFLVMSSWPRLGLRKGLGAKERHGSKDEVGGATGPCDDRQAARRVLVRIGPVPAVSLHCRGRETHGPGATCRQNLANRDTQHPHSSAPVPASQPLRTAVQDGIAQQRWSISGESARARPGGPGRHCVRH